MSLHLFLLAQPVILRSILRDDETFSRHLTEDLSVPPAVIQSLMDAKIQFNPVSTLDPSVNMVETEKSLSVVRAPAK